MNIGFDAKRFANNSRGLGSYARNLITALGKYAPSLKLHLYSPVPLKPEWQAPHYEMPSNAIFYSPKKRLAKLRQHYLRFIKIQRQAEQHQLDLYHGLSNVLPKKLSCPTVVTIHDLIFLHYPQLYPAIDRFYYNHYFKSAAQRASIVFAVSKATKQDICDAFSIPSDRVRVIYPSLDPVYHPNNFTEREKLRVRDIYQLPPNFILQLGAIEPRKNCQMLLRAFSRLPVSLRKEFRVLFAGATGKYMKSLEKLIASLGITQQVRFLGHVPLKDVPALYAQASACVYLSLMEGFGLPVLESLQCNTICLTSNCSSMPEAGGTACLLANPEDPEQIAYQLQKLLTDNHLRKKLKANIPKHLSLFSPQRISQQITEGYAFATGKTP